MPAIATEKQLQRLKETLPIYRKLLGYSAEKLGHFLGLRRQQINSLETGRTKLTQVHFRALSQIIYEIIAEKLESNEFNIALFVIQVLLGLNEDALHDEEFLAWKETLSEFTQLKDVGGPEKQIRLLKGFALASKHLDKGDTIPPSELLDNIIKEFRGGVSKIETVISGSE